MKRELALTVAMILMPIAQVQANPLKVCPKFQPSYSSCQKVGGGLPSFFSSVQIEQKDDGFAFVTETDMGPTLTEYVPDRVVRLGSDYHYQDDGTVLPELPAHESSYCDQGTLHRSEITFLPDNTYAQEEITMEINDDGVLEFELIVGEDMLLSATCTPDNQSGDSQ